MWPSQHAAQSDRRGIVAWALYDWANSGFALIVISAFFPLFLRQYWNDGGDTGSSTLQLGLANSAASILIVLLAPVLGAVADRGSAKKRYLLAFTALAVLMTAALALAARGEWLLALSVYVAASIGFHGANIFYDALIVDVARNEQMHTVSALGFGLGYLGGGLLFALCATMALAPQRFGLADGEQAVRLSFVLVAVWWSLFTIPLLLFVRETRSPDRSGGSSALTDGVCQLVDTFRQMRRLRPVWIFLLAYWCYVDGVYTISRMALDYGMALGFRADNLVVALLITQFVGFPAALAFGYAGNRLGAKSAILAGIGVYSAATVWSVFMTDVVEFYVLAVVIGLVQGGVQSLSRSFFAGIIPSGQAGQFFGFYNMVGRLAAVLGPLLVGLTSALTGSPRLSITVILPLFLVGAGLLYCTRE